MKTIIAIMLCALLWQPATVIDVNDDIVAIEFEDGNVYEFYGNNFDNGDVVSVLKVLDVIVDVR